MKVLITIGLALYLPLSAFAQSDDSLLDTYLQKASGRPADQIESHIVSVNSPGGVTYFGLVQVPQALEAQDSKAFIFVAKTGQGGSVVELARSKPFDFWSAGGRHYVEIVEARLSGRFTLQINYRGACTAGYDLYRFAQRDSAWIVTGRDSARFLCEPGDVGAGDSRDERSANFLTGVIVNTAYRHGKVTSRRTKHQASGVHAIADFDPFDEKYGPR